MNDPPYLKDDHYDYIHSNRVPMSLSVLENDSSFPDAEGSEILRIVDWEIDMTSNDALAYLPTTGHHPYQ